MTEWLKMKLRETDLKISTWPKMKILTIALFILSIFTMMVSFESANWRLREISNSELPSYSNSSASLLNGSATKSINITFSKVCEWKYPVTWKEKSEAATICVKPLNFLKKVTGPKFWKPGRKSKVNVERSQL